MISRSAKMLQLMAIPTISINNSLVVGIVSPQSLIFNLQSFTAKKIEDQRLFAEELHHFGALGLARHHFDKRDAMPRKNKALGVHLDVIQAVAITLAHVAD